jgi:hypothetical protein
MNNWSKMVAAVKSMQSTMTEVVEFLRQAARVPAVAAVRGRLIFALDATASRQPTWDRACQLQGEMFAAVAEPGGLAIQLVWYRGYGEFKAEPWLIDSAELQRRMTAVHCCGGLTQVGRVLQHALQETRRQRVNALALVGDCLEEPVDPLCHFAGELGLLGVPVFAFQEGNDLKATQGFQEIARLTHGAYCRFDAGSARQLRELLRAVAVYAAGGHQALATLGQQRELLCQLTRSK